jgi:SAM-dependent methyltransferase
VARPLRTLGYDSVARSYDSHFTRPIDRWEDERLSGLLAPLIDHRQVLDLGCGTGWVLDHCRPASYVGLDASAAMLTELKEKHPGAEVIQAEIGTPGWSEELGGERFDAIVATWAAEYFPSLPELLRELRRHLGRYGTIALHGCQPRGSRRGHFISAELAHQGRLFVPARVIEAGDWAGLHQPVSYGTGALPDPLARWRPPWTLALPAPVAWHYGALHVWET